MSFQWTMVVMLAITLFAALYVAWPLLFGRTRPEEFLGGETSEPVLQRLLFQRDAVYSAMKELDFDLAMGNLSREDFQKLQERYKRKAVAILKRIDDAKAGKLRNASVPEAEEGYLDDIVPFGRSRPRREDAEETELDVEQEIQSFRRDSRAQNGRGGAASASKTASVAVCPQCGQKTKDPGAAFCSKCGAPIRKKR